jgi:hypothetical protein
MSVEAMSPGASVATAQAVSAPGVIGAASGEMSFNSISEFSAFGGTRMAGFDQSEFSETFQIPSPTLDSFEGGKYIPNISAFENTQVLWEVPETNKDTQTPDIPESQDNQIFETVVRSEVSLSQTQPEIMAGFKSEPGSNMEQVAESPTAEEIITDSKVETNDLTRMSDEMIQQKAIARVREAIKIEETSLMKTKEPEREMEKPAVKTEEITAIKTQRTAEKEEVKEEKDNKINNQPAKLYFEHDTKADETRKTAGLNAIEKVSKEISDEKIVEATGRDIVEQMPNPQPKEVKSEIAKGKDGSYESLIKQLETAGTIYSASEAKGLVEKSVIENHAIRMNNALSSQEATEDEVRKVLNGKL